MTDNYDLDPHEHPETHTDESHESKAEAWPDDQPPADGYEDPGIEETATSSEETGGAPQEDTMDAAPRKSSPIMPIAAGIGGLLLVGAVLYWQFGRSPSSSITSATSPPPLQMVQPVTPPPAPVAAVSSANGPNTLIPSTSANDVAPKTAMAPSAENPAVAMPAPAASAPIIVASTPAPVAAPAEPSPIEAVAPPTTFPAPSATQTASTTTAATDSADARLGSLASRIDEMKKEIDQINTGLVSSSPTTPGIEERLTRLEQQLKQVEHGPSGTATAQNSTSDEASEITAAAPVTKPAHHETRHNKSHNHTASKSSKHGTQVTKAAWVLRAATPSEAWVAKDEGSADLRRVKVGDKLPGVGRVNAIHQVGDNWVVEGTAGSIR